MLPPLQNILTGQRRLTGYAGNVCNAPCSRGHLQKWAWINRDNVTSMLGWSLQ